MRLKLILNFDINKTLIMSDNVKNVSTKEMANAIIAESVFGTLKDASQPREERQFNDWIPLNTDYVLPASRDIIDNTVDYCNYSEYLENFTAMSKKERRKYTTTFTDSDMGLGYKEYFNHLYTCLQIPSDALESCLSTTDETSSPLSDVNHELLTYFRGNLYHIIPSFFEAIKALIKCKDIDFKIMFRTFGTDVKNIVSEFNLFCENKHPLFPLDGYTLDGKGPVYKDYRIKDDYQLSFERTGSSELDVVLHFKGRDKVSSAHHIYTLRCSKTS